MGKKSSKTPRTKAGLSPDRTPATSAALDTVSFPIVGIGASAGGLPALEQFVRRVPAGSGMAFVVVQHLDPARKGIMADLLQRSTPMKVREIRDGMQIHPDEVYVIPPNYDLSILHGVLQLLPPPPGKGLRLPIDYFLNSLALDRREHAIGVVLSGMGSDGTAGLRTIKEKGGLVAVQEPSTAEFDSMPRSVVEAGLADISAPVEELPGKILGWVGHPPQFPGKETET
jgi:chemotaxis response regulator CheB